MVSLLTLNKFYSETSMQHCMMTSTKPPNLGWKVIIIMMSIYISSSSTNLTGPTTKYPNFNKSQHKTTSSLLLIKLSTLITLKQRTLIVASTPVCTLTTFKPIPDSLPLRLWPSFRSHHYLYEGSRSSHVKAGTVTVPPAVSAWLTQVVTSSNVVSSQIAT